MTWLRAFVSQVTVFRGLAASAVVSLRDERPEPSPSRRAMCEAGEALFARAQQAGEAPKDTAFADVLWLTGAIAAVTEREPDAAYDCCRSPRPGWPRKPLGQLVSGTGRMARGPRGDPRHLRHSRG